MRLLGCFSLENEIWKAWAFALHFFSLLSGRNNWDIIECCFVICLSYGMSYLICYQSLICSGSRAWKRLFYIAATDLGVWGVLTGIKANLSNIPTCVKVACDQIPSLFLSTRHRKCTYRRRRRRELITSTVRGQTQHASASGENLCLHTQSKKSTQTYPDELYLNRSNRAHTV